MECHTLQLEGGKNNNVKMDIEIVIQKLNERFKVEWFIKKSPWSKLDKSKNFVRKEGKKRTKVVQLEKIEVIDGFLVDKLTQEKANEIQKIFLECEIPIGVSQKSECLDYEVYITKQEAMSFLERDSPVDWKKAREESEKLLYFLEQQTDKSGLKIFKNFLSTLPKIKPYNHPFLRYFK